MFYKKIYLRVKLKTKVFCHACHTRFAVFFPLPSCCVSSLILIRFRRFLKNLQVIMTTILKSFRALSTIVMLQGLFLCILETSQICDLDLHSTNKRQCSSPLLRYSLPNVDSSLIHLQINADLHIGEGEKKFTHGKVRKFD